MFDTDFYIKSCEIQKAIQNKEKFNEDEIYNKLENLRQKENIFVYNIETTNACNMRCKMCPRTTMMTRSISTINTDLFRKILNQLKPIDLEAWKRWEKFIEEIYGIPKNTMSENHFFLYIIPRVIQLHGYGDPLLDPNISKYVKILTEKGFESYFSCNPSNINIEKTLELFKSGLTYIKYSIESVDDENHKKIRGYASNFTESYRKILKLLELKKQYNLKTTIIITMIDLGSPNQKEEYQKLKKAFEGLDVYIYLKSEDQQWYRKDFHGTNSIHWSEFCKHPWMSMTIKSNGEVAMCMEDFNNEIVLGDANVNTLLDIWNGENYKKFREDHIDCNPSIKCTERCDMCIIGEYINNNNNKIDFSKIKLVISDFDGTLTDNRVLVDENGKESVFCDRGDGLGIENLKKNGIKFMILSKEKNPVVLARAKKLNCEVLNGIDDKLSILQNVIKNLNISQEEICYIGNDTNDIDCIKFAGIGVVVKDSNEKVLRIADYITKKRGGDGAVREICDLIL